MGLTMGSEMPTRRRSKNATMRRIQARIEMILYLSRGLCSSLSVNCIVDTKEQYPCTSSGKDLEMS